MNEQSQIDAMRAAVRGDIERSRARRESGDAGPPEPPPIDLRARPKKLVPVRARRPEPDEPVAVEVEEPAAVAEPAVPRRGLLRRLFRR